MSKCLVQKTPYNLNRSFQESKIPPQGYRSLLSNSILWNKRKQRCVTESVTPVLLNVYLKFCIRKFDFNSHFSEFINFTSHSCHWNNINFHMEAFCQNICFFTVTVRPAKTQISLIRVFAVHMKKAWVLTDPLSGQRRLWSDWADAQSDQSLRCLYEESLGP